MNYQSRITANCNIMLGKPIIKGTRLTVELLLRKLSEGLTTAELLECYPSLTTADVLAALAYSASVIEREEMISCREELLGT